MYKILTLAVTGWALLSMTAATWADGRDWASYRGVERTTSHYRPPPRSYHPDHAGTRDWTNRYPYQHQHGSYQFRYTPSTRYEYHYQRRFYPGEQLPVQYRHSRYYLEDWRHHHLDEPPRGYRWMIIDGQYVLVSTPHVEISIIR